jgi:uncharacterized membrane protein
MRTRFAHFRELFKSKFWIIPALTSLGIMGLLPLLQILDLDFSTQFGRFFAYQGTSADGARMLLAAIATAAMTVVGVLFSITVVVLQQVSTQYTPRVIENFIRSASTQLVLGFYIGNFGYCLLLLRAIKGGDTDGQRELHQAGVTAAIILALICLALLIFYVHHIAKSIKSNHIFAGITKEACQAIRDVRRDLEAHSKGAVPSLQSSGTAETVILSDKSGYLQEIRWNRLKDILGSLNWRAEIQMIPGDYVHRQMPLLHLFADQPLPEDLEVKIRKLFFIDLVRTHTQDIRFGVRQMVDVALRALSPGINDPSTAIEGINELGAVLLHYANVAPVDQEQSGTAEAWDGQLRIRQPSYEEMVHEAFDQLALSGRPFRSVLVRIKDVLSHCHSQARYEIQKSVLQQRIVALESMIAHLELDSPIRFPSFRRNDAA